MHTTHTEAIDFPPGVIWECVRCATCCGDTSTHVRRILLLDEEARKISQTTGLDLEKFSKEATDSAPYSREIRKNRGKCVFLRDNTCQIYEHRPLVCRFFPFGVARQNDRLTFYLTKEPCQGLGRGEELDKRFYASLLKNARKRMEGAQT